MTGADLVGAVRLPTGAHRRTAGTEAVTDLVIFRRREPDREPGDDTWIRTTPLRIAGELRDKRINRYFDQHPDRVLGQVNLGHGMHNAETLIVRADDLTATPAALRSALSQIIADAKVEGLTASDRTERAPHVVAEGIQPRSHPPEEPPLAAPMTNAVAGVSSCRRSP